MARPKEAAAAPVPQGPAWGVWLAPEPHVPGTLVFGHPDAIARLEVSGDLRPADPQDIRIGYRQARHIEGE